MSLKQNIIYIYFKGKHQVTSKSQYQYNRGQYLYFADLNLPQAFEVHFSNKDKGESKTQIGSDNLVEIPDEYFWNGALQIYAWIYLHSKTTDGETIYEVRIPLTKRAKPTDEEPLPVQQSAIDKAIAELNNAVNVTTENANKTESDKIIVANIKDEVVDLKEDIDSTATTINQKAQETIDASERAETSAQNAATSENKALNYSQQAEQSAQSALESKNIAQQKSEVATNASNEALGYRDEALEAKNQAVQAKQNIVDYRDETKGYRDETLNLKNNVQTLKNQIDETAEEIEDISDSVKEDAQSASQSASSASQSANSASQSANQAEQYKNQSETNVTHYPKVVDGYWYVWDASNAEYVNTNVDARGIKGDKGDTGETGVGIESTVLNSDYTLTITFTDDTSYTTPSIRGEKGLKGDIGNGIASTVLNNDYTLTINFTDGTQYTTPPIRGIRGAQGERGEKGDTGAQGIQGERGLQGAKGDKGDKGDTGATGAQGIQGAKGDTGADGISPTVTITPITGGHRITITDKDGEHSADVMDGTGNVDDVQINGQSIVENGVANVPVASSAGFGVVKATGDGGITLSSNGNLQVTQASASQIKTGTTQSRIISPAKQHESTFYGLAKSAGDTTQSQSSNPVGVYTDYAKGAIQNMLDVPSNDDVVNDVQIDGTSIVENGVANVPYANSYNAGVVGRLTNIFGILSNNVGQLYIYSATDDDMKRGTGDYRPLTAPKQHISTFYGLAKAAGDTTQSQSSNAVGTYTDEAKTAIKQMLGVHDTIDSFVEEVTGTDVTITGQPSYRYNCGELYSLTITPPSSGTIDIRFTSGSTPTVLTLPSTVKMPEWWVEVEANTIYEMCITDGVYCGVMTWAM